MRQTVTLIIVTLIFCLSPALTCAQIAPATTVQLPVFGVAIDADGTMTAKMFAESGGRLFIERARAAHTAMDADMFAATKLRKISLARLEQAIRKKLAAGEELTDAMINLAGLQRIQYVFVYPDTHDIVIAGPAGGWIVDAGGRTVSVATNRPVILLDDLLVALRVFAPGKTAKTWIGCSIDPTREGLERLAEFNKTVPRSIRTSQRDLAARNISAGIQASLGTADVKTFGIASTNHLAQVLIEADYRMKMIAIGLEPPPIKMATFISQLRTAPKNSMQRWWFTPNIKSVRVTKDRTAMELVGEGAQLLTEDYRLDAAGRLSLKHAKPSGASHAYSQAFTKKYAEIARVSPVFAQLRNMIDVLVMGAYLNKENIYELSGWTPGLLLDEKLLPVENLPAIRTAPCLANAVWKGSRLIAPAGGGVSIVPVDALTPDNLLADEQGTLQQRWLDTKFADADWWWD